jgi:hypothetical protein
MVTSFSAMQFEFKRCQGSINRLCFRDTCRYRYGKIFGECGSHAQRKILDSNGSRLLSQHRWRVRLSTPFPDVEGTLFQQPELTGNVL